MKTIYERALQSTYDQSPAEWFTGCHKHRIVPGYNGGDYVEGNVVYLTQSEHRLVHWLRWKLFKDSRDKRAYKMIGAGPSGLSHQDRIDHGKMCKKLGLGIHSPDFDKANAARKSMDVQREEYEKTHNKNFYYWSTKQGRSERASLGGLQSCQTNQAFIDQMGSFKDKDLARIASSKSAKKPVHKNGVICKFHTDEDVDAFLANNPGWRRGTGRNYNQGHKYGPSPKRKRVTDGIKIYESLAEAGLTYGKSSATIMNWCRSDAKPEWRYYE